jgi:hypothetical protein
VVQWSLDTRSLVIDKSTSMYGIILVYMLLYHIALAKSQAYIDQSL